MTAYSVASFLSGCSVKRWTSDTSGGIVEHFEITAQYGVTLTESVLVFLYQLFLNIDFELYGFRSEDIFFEFRYAGPCKVDCRQLLCVLESIFVDSGNSALEVDALQLTTVAESRFFDRHS